MNAGERIRALREERGMRAADIERQTQRLADELGNPDYVIPHATLNGIEAGSVPTIYKLASLAAVMDLRIEQLLVAYGIDLSKVRTHLKADLVETGARIEFPGREPDAMVLRAAAGIFVETQLVQTNSPVWDGLPPGLRDRLGSPVRFSYAVVGAKEDILGDVLPGGSFVEIDRDQNKVARFAWMSVLERPIYCVWHGEGHVCCWCEQAGNLLTIVPHPLSRQQCVQLRIPRDATVIGRVTNFWRLLKSN
jgi:transcriptional regulator with XRE-family HTH domain